MVRVVLAFLRRHLDSRFGRDWCPSPEQSLTLHAGNWTVPRQLLVRSPKARNKIADLPHHTSLLDVRAALPAREDREEKEGLRIFSRESALVACSPRYFSSNATDVRTVVPMIREASGLLARLPLRSPAILSECVHTEVQRSRKR